MKNRKCTARRVFFALYLLTLRVIFKVYFHIKRLISYKECRVILKFLLYIGIWLIAVYFLVNLDCPPGLVFFLLFVGFAIFITQIRNLVDKFYD